jgi:hypothetical protein
MGNVFCETYQTKGLAQCNMALIQTYYVFLTLFQSSIKAMNTVDPHYAAVLRNWIYHWYDYVPQRDKLYKCFNYNVGSL